MATARKLKNLSGVMFTPSGRGPRKTRGAPIWLFALDLDAHVLHVRFHEFEREIWLTFLLLDEDVFAIVHLDAEALGAEFGREGIANILGEIVLGASAPDADRDVGGITLTRRDAEHE